MNKSALAATVAGFALISGSPVQAAVQEAVDACIDKLRAEGSPDSKAGTVLSSEFSEAGTLVMLKDRGGTVWRCIAYSDGTVGELSVADPADDGGGAMDGADTSAATSTETAPAATTTEGTQRISFASGTSGAVVDVHLKSGDAMNYLLEARDGQFLDVKLETDSRSLFYMIYVPDGGILYESSQAGNTYRGQLYETGDHRIEVFYNGDVGTEGMGRLTIGIE
ncbi:MAG: hypothetical protein K5905_13285 [Roseibium sp.]|uniref:hypothetical protein n=1 Tax=Roseibium sp. TaxID=1936156 RepID=UPI00260A747B|nr:hypothetical protein [Roseibium sp.]MCV0426441.1 hypothetical protein [Roseibium sp.]